MRWWRGCAPFSKRRIPGSRKSRLDGAEDLGEDEAAVWGADEADGEAVEAGLEDVLAMQRAIHEGDLGLGGGFGVVGAEAGEVFAGQAVSGVGAGEEALDGDLTGGVVV